MSETPAELAESSEKWLPAPGFEGYYEVSNKGRVRGLDRHVQRRGKPMKIRGRILRYENRHGYHVVPLSKDGRKEKVYVHRLVLMAFRGLPEPGQEGCHGNDIRSDNRIENLRWDSHLANVRDCVERGRHREIGYYNRDKTECDRGHPFDEANTLVRPEGRTCKACRRLKERERYHKEKARLGIPSRAYKPLPHAEVA